MKWTGFREKGVISPGYETVLRRRSIAWPVSHADEVDNIGNAGVGGLEHVVGVLSRKLEVECRSCGIKELANGFFCTRVRCSTDWSCLSP